MLAQAALAVSAGSACARGQRDIDAAKAENARRTPVSAIALALQTELLLCK
jgi:hypothetical protein